MGIIVGQALAARKQNLLRESYPRILGPGLSFCPYREFADLGTFAAEFVRYQAFQVSSCGFLTSPDGRRTANFRVNPGGPGKTGR